MKPESFDQQFASVFGDPETRRLAKIACARNPFEQRRSENHSFRQGIQMLRLAEMDAIRAGDEHRARGIREAIDTLVESWRLRP